MQEITVQLSELTVKVTDKMDAITRVTHEVGKHTPSCFQASIELGGRNVLFTLEQLEMVADVIRGVFYRCYGGWNVCFKVDAAGMFTDKMNFVPACAQGFAGH